jgi:hypothetical protein
MARTPTTPSSERPRRRIRPKMIGAFLTLEYRLPEGYSVSLVVRHGGRAAPACRCSSPRPATARSCGSTTSADQNAPAR